MSLVLTAYEVGDLQLDIERRVLSGPRGTITLCAQMFDLAERVLRRPGALVRNTDLIAAMYADPDNEPDNAEVILRTRLVTLRVAFAVLSHKRVSLRSERGVGYAAQVTPR